MAGLVCYYNSAKFHYLYVSHDETVGKHLRVMSCLPGSGAVGCVHAAHRRFPAASASHLRVEVDYERLHFALSRRGRRRLALAAAAVRRQHPLRRSHRAGTAEFHRRVRRHGLPGPGRHGACPPTSTISSIRNATIVRPSKCRPHEIHDDGTSYRPASPARRAVYASRAMQWTCRRRQPAVDAAADEDGYKLWLRFAPPVTTSGGDTSRDSTRSSLKGSRRRRIIRDEIDGGARVDRRQPLTHDGPGARRPRYRHADELGDHSVPSAGRTISRRPAPKAS